MLGNSIASIYSTFGTKLGFFLARSTFFRSSRLTLAEGFRGDYVAACSTALRSTTEENDSGGYVDVPCPSKVKQRKSTADWLKVLWRHQIGSDVTRT